MAVADPKDQNVRVVDRRWWARGDADGGDEGAARKPTYVEELERRVADQAEQLQAFASERRRAFDDLEQARVRIRREVSREVERGRRAVLAELLDVVDNLDRAIAAARETADAATANLLRGVELVRDQFLAKLAGFGVTRIDVLGRPFDATIHEAVSMAPVDDPACEGTVVAVLREGYVIGDELLRPAAVIVATNG